MQESLRMRRCAATWRLAFLALCAACIPFPAVGGASAATHPSRLIAAPLEGHRGAVLYLSGGGFPAHKQLELKETCSSSPTPIVLSGPITTQQGTFAAFQMTAPRRSSGRPFHCRIYAAGASGGNPPPGQVPATYTVVPSNQSLQRCAREMCLKLTAILVLNERGAQGHVVIAGWPGAVATAAVVYPGGKVKYRNITIGWQGAGAVRVSIAKRLKRAMKARVYVTATLGSMSSTAGATFIILPNR